MSDLIDLAFRAALQGVPTPKDMQVLKSVVFEGSDARAARILTWFLNNSADYGYTLKRDDCKYILRYLDGEKYSPYVVGEALTAMVSAGCRDKLFISMVIEIARCADWDTEESARIGAVLSLPDLKLPEAVLRDLLQGALRSPRPAVRDAVAVSVQKVLGIHPLDVCWGDGTGDVFAKLPKQYLQWLLN